MDDKYNHANIEQKWSDIWEKIKLNEVETGDPEKPYYNLMMFPYPSAEGLHVGNMYAFTGSDIFGRYKRLQGFTVFEPIGLDGFGIHSENYALKIGRHPMDHAAVTQKNYYLQLRKIGAMFDWTKTVETYNPDYYHWTQWLFVEMFKHGLAYRGKASVNWCPSCKTVLADEQVIEGLCERCGNAVEKRLLEQWFFKITAYAENLLSEIAGLNWTEKVKIAQRNWIGQKKGIIISFKLKDSEKKIDIFTTTPVNYAATFLVLAPEHPLIGELVESEQRDAVEKYQRESQSMSDQDRVAQGRKKTGVFTGAYAINHLTGESLPIWISDFVIMSVGTGAIQACPGHDARDFEFAKTFGLPIKRVVVGSDGDTSEIQREEQVIGHGPGKMINSDFLNGLDFEEAMEKTMDYFEKKGWGKRVSTYHLRDWIISRQRYWGPPIPMIFCKTCSSSGKGERDDMPGWYTVPETQLPVVLPRIEDYKPGNDGIAPLAKHKEFYETTCPSCGGKAVRETDVSDTFLDSAWYFLRYPSLGSESKETAPFDDAITKKWLPVDMYTGGAEHSVLHLLYARFISHALHDWKRTNFKEPFSTFYAHGLVIKDGAKMSKSKGNVVNPDDYIKTYGADALRLYLMFLGPYNQGGDFRDSAMEGTHRWVNRIWKIAMETINQGGSVSQENDEVERALHRLVKKVGDDLEGRRYNTAIASMMEFTNLISDKKVIIQPATLKTFLILLASFAPHLTEELWQRLQGKADLKSKSDSIHFQKWPTFDSSKLVDTEVVIVVQVNGKVRDKLVVSLADSNNKAVMEELALNSEKVRKHLGTAAATKKVIVIPGKLVNVVV